MCIYICMYMYIFTCIFEFIYICIYLYVYIMYIYINICNKCIYVNICIYNVLKCMTSRKAITSILCSSYFYEI